MRSHSYLVDVHWLNDERKVEEPTLKTLLDRIRITREQLDGNARMNAMHLDKRIREQMRRTRLSGTDANGAERLPPWSASSSWVWSTRERISSAR